MACTTSSSSVHHVLVKFWKSLWKLQALPHCKEVAWCAVRGILPVRKLLRVRGIDNEEVCPFCNDEAASIDHILLVCPVVVRHDGWADGGSELYCSRALAADI